MCGWNRWSVVTPALLLSLALPGAQGLGTVFRGRAMTPVQPWRRWGSAPEAGSEDMRQDLGPLLDAAFGPESAEVPRRRASVFDKARAYQVARPAEEEVVEEPVEAATPPDEPKEKPEEEKPEETAKETAKAKAKEKDGMEFLVDVAFGAGETMETAPMPTALDKARDVRGGQMAPEDGEPAKPAEVVDDVPEPPAKEVARVAEAPALAQRKLLPIMRGLYIVAAAGVAARAGSELGALGKAVGAMESLRAPSEAALAALRKATCAVGIALLLTMDFKPNALTQVERLDAVPADRRRDPEMRAFSSLALGKMFAELAAAWVMAFSGRVFAGAMAILASHFVYFLRCKNVLDKEGTLQPFPVQIKNVLVGLDLMMLGLLAIAGSVPAVKWGFHAPASFCFLGLAVSAVWQRVKQQARMKSAA